MHICAMLWRVGCQYLNALMCISSSSEDCIVTNTLGTSCRSVSERRVGTLSLPGEGGSIPYIFVNHDTAVSSRCSYKELSLLSVRTFTLLPSLQTDQYAFLARDFNPFGGIAGRLGRVCSRVKDSHLAASATHSRPVIRRVVEVLADTKDVKW